MAAPSTKPAVIPLDGFALPEPGNELRCRHKSSSGRRCERAADPANFGFCVLHDADAQRFREAEARAIAAELLGAEASLGDPASVNRLLAKLFMLVAHGRIPLPTAALLTQIGQLILQSFGGNGAPHGEVRLSEVNNAWRQTIVHVLNSAGQSSEAAPASQISFQDFEPPLGGAIATDSGKPAAEIDSAHSEDE